MKKLFLLLLPALLFLASCDDDDAPSNGNLELSFTGLEDLGSDYVYEGWVIVDGSPVSTGVFSVDGSGALSKTQFSVKLSDLNAATKFVLTIEPANDPAPDAPSDVKILGGDFSSTTASLTVGDGAALGDDFSASTGKYILATPTDGGSNTNENSGVWWLDNSGASPVAGLSLPTLPSGWKYEGWAVINGQAVSTGTFTSVSGSDAAAPYSGTTAGPAYPGEDFLMNAPSGVTFPVDLAGKTVVISVEPVPDNSASPFFLKPLLGSVPAMATDHTVYSMTNNAATSNPTGTATR